MSEEKPKREFLKKGTRKFLANSSVKKEPYKLHDFNMDGEDIEEVKVPPKRIPEKLTEKTSAKKQSRVVKETREVNPPPRVPIHSRSKKQQVSSKDIRQIPQWNRQSDQDEIFEVRGKKAQPPKNNIKQTTQYVKNQYEDQDQDQGLDAYLNKNKGLRQPSPKRSFTRQSSQKNIEQQSYYQPKSTSYSNTKQQPKKYDFNQQQKPITTYKRQQNQSIREKYQYVEPKVEIQEDEDINFDDDEQFNPNEKKLRQSNIQQQKQIKQSNYNHSQQSSYQQVPSTQHQHKQQQQQPYSEAPKRSKIVQQIFMSTKNSKTKNPTSSHSSKLKISDIPDDLKIQIVKQGIQKIQQKLSQQVQKVTAEQKNLNLKIFKYQQQIRQLQRLKKKQQDQFQQKKQQFEQYMKKQRTKIAKDQKVIKDSLQNRYTRKQRQQIQEYKKQVEDVKEEKRKSENKLRMEIDRLKKRLDEQISKTKQLEDEVKILELDRIKEKQKVGVQNKTVSAMNKTRNIVQPVYKFVTGPDKNILSMKSQDFNIKSLPIQLYSHENNIYYQQYKHFPRSTQLQYSVNQNQGIKRCYKDRRVQFQRQNHYTKQIFPNGYKIIHYLRGHIKQQLPQGIVIYYDSDTQIVQFSISSNRKIHYFFQNNQVQMKTQIGNKLNHQIYDGKNFRQKNL